MLPPPGADRVDVELRQPQGETAHAPLRAAPGAAVADQAHVGRGAAHVEADRVGNPGGDHRGHTAGGPGEEQPRRVGGRLVDRRRRRRLTASPPAAAAPRPPRSRRAGADTGPQPGRGRRRRSSSMPARTPGTRPRPRARRPRARRAGPPAARRRPPARGAGRRRRAAGTRRRPRTRSRRSRARRPLHRRRLQRPQHAARPDALVHLDRHLGQRRGRRLLGPVQVRTCLAPERGHVARSRAWRRSAVRAPRRSSIAFVATVVPWPRWATSPAPRPASASASRTPAITPTEWSATVVATLAVTSLPPATRATSVNVPPTSTPTIARIARRGYVLAGVARSSHIGRPGAIMLRRWTWPDTTRRSARPERAASHSDARRRSASRS